MTLRQKARDALGPLSPYCEPCGDGAHPAMVPIVWAIVLDGFEDSSVFDGVCQVSRVGRWLVWQTEQGFVKANRYGSADIAQTMLERLG